MISVGLVADHTHEAPSDHTGVGCPVCLPTRTHAGPASAHCRPSAPREAGEASRHPWVGGRPSDRPQCPCLRAGTIIATSVQGVCGRCRPGPIARLWDPWGPQSPSGRGLTLQRPYTLAQGWPHLSCPETAQEAITNWRRPWVPPSSSPGLGPKVCGSQGTVRCLPPNYSPPPFTTTTLPSAHPQIPGLCPNEASVPWKGPTS